MQFINPNKKFHINKENLEISKENRTALDLWRWGFSDLVQNINRGILAEFIIAWALKLDNTPRNPWDPYDLITEDGKRIEVKSTGYLQSWDYGTKPYPKFIIQQRQRWTESGLETNAEYNADVYILCYHKEKKRDKLDPMDLNQWDFWVFSKNEIVSLLKNRKSISVSQLEKEEFKPITILEIYDKVMNI